MLQKDPKILIPPNFLATVVLIFWGVAVDSVLLSLVLSLLLDGRKWIPLEWDFDENAQLKALQFSLLLIGAGVGISWIEEEGRLGLITILRWFPVYFLPVEFVQRYGKTRSMNFNSFFYFSRKRMLQDRLEGREVKPSQINTGYFYLFGCVCAATTVREIGEYFWIGLGGVLLLIFAAVYRERGMKPRLLLFTMVAVMGVGWGIQWTMLSVHEWARERLRGRFTSSMGEDVLVDFVSMIAPLGGVQQSSKIEWRVWGENPIYLRMGSFNSFNMRRWVCRFSSENISSLDESYDVHSQRLALHSQRLGLQGGGQYYVYRSAESPNRDYSHKGNENMVRGTLTHKRSAAVVPTVPGYFGVSGIVGEGTYPRVNTMGAMRLENRDMVINYTLHSLSNESVIDEPPTDMIDLAIGENEHEVIRRFVQDKGLHKGMPAQEIIQQLRSCFKEEFEYTTQFDAGVIEKDGGDLEYFLTELKKGHCEYYATATVLILRELGIPARYTIGYVVKEREGEHWNVRGTDAHAWARAYVGGKWMNVDLTPPSLRGSVGEKELGSIEWLRERITLWREDFYVWREKAENREKLLWRVGGVAAFLLLWIIFRLWKSRAKERGSIENYTYYEGEVMETALNKLERWVSRKIGAREIGEPYGKWLYKLNGIGEVSEVEIQQVLDIHQRMRFGKAQKNDPVRLLTLVRELKRLGRKE